VNLALGLGLPYGGQAGASLAALSPFIWLDTADLGTMFQETTGASATTPSEVDDPVGSMRDKASGIWFTAPADASRPILRSSGGLFWLEFAGTDDMLAATFAWAQPLTRMTAVRLLAAGDNQFINEGDGEKIQLRIAGNAAVFMNDGIASGNVMIGTLTVDTDFIVTEEWDGANSQGALDAGAFTSIAADTVAANEWNIGARAGASGAVNMRWPGAVGFTRILTAAQRAQALTLLAATQGRVL
jgi:hypothetical protein